MIGHNNPPEKINPYQERFAACVNLFRKLGMKGEVAFTPENLIVSVCGKYDASAWRKAFKIVTQKNKDVMMIETRPVKGAYIFTLFFNI
jgi:hypothetical protein